MLEFFYTGEIDKGFEINRGIFINF